MSDPDFDQVRSKLTVEFVETLAEAARSYGWTGDFVEVERFVRYVANEAYIELHDGALDV